MEDKKNASSVVAIIAVVVLVVVLGAIYKLTLGKGSAPAPKEIPEGQVRPGMGPEQPGGQQDIGDKMGPGAKGGVGQPMPGMQQDPGAKDPDETTLRLPDTGGARLCREATPLLPTLVAREPNWGLPAAA